MNPTGICSIFFENLQYYESYDNVRTLHTYHVCPEHIATNLNVQHLLEMFFSIKAKSEKCV
ncbi:MAG: hypothetical protein AB1444_09070 [Spirochaetota bacterium]